MNRARRGRVCITAIAIALIVGSASSMSAAQAGNGRMVTTLPRVHVAITGIEKVVPTLEDVATLLRLLPRSATGQSISN